MTGPDAERPPRVRKVRRRPEPGSADRGDVSADDTDVGWGERADERSSDDWYRRERPPHHGG